MSDIWDGLFESTSLNIDPSKPAQAAPKAVTVEPAAKTAPAPSAAPKRVRKSAKATAATPIPDAPTEPAADASIFFGSDDADEIGTAGATAQAQATLTERLPPGCNAGDAASQALSDILNGDDDYDPFEEAGLDVAPVPLIDLPPPMVELSPEIETTAKKRAGRPVGSKKKNVTVEQFVEKMEAVERGEPVADKTFHGTPEPYDRGSKAQATEAVPTEIEILARTITRAVLDEIAAYLRRQNG